MKMIEAAKVPPLIRLVLMKHPYAEEIMEQMQMLIDRQTVEAVPVVHGRWIPKQDGFWKKQILICSICGSRNALNYEFNHCPNCGANMRMEGVE